MHLAIQKIARLVHEPVLSKDGLYICAEPQRAPLRGADVIFGF